MPAPEPLAVMVVVPDTVAPFTGAVIKAVGGVPPVGVVTLRTTSSTRNVVGSEVSVVAANWMAIVCPAKDTKLIAAGWKYVPLVFPLELLLVLFRLRGVESVVPEAFSTFTERKSYAVAVVSWVTTFTQNCRVAAVAFAGMA